MATKCCSINCFHCGNAIKGTPNIFVETEKNKFHSVCCHGCKLAAESLQNIENDKHEVNEWLNYDIPQIQKDWLVVDGDYSEMTLHAADIHCVSCSLTIERELNAINAISDVSINVTTRDIHIRWLTTQLKVSDILQLLARIGYRARPVHLLAAENILEKRQALKRLIVAALGMMQVMMYAVALYAGAFQGIDPNIKFFLQLVSMLVATPVMFYSGRPFFIGAWRAMLNRQAGMDLPVALALSIAYFASVLAVFKGSGEIYFDSVTMFVFFLSFGRYFEMRARHKTTSETEALSEITPLTATLIMEGEYKTVAANSLQVGDQIMVKPGEVIATDVLLASEQTKVDESLLTGESVLVQKQQGDLLVGGSINHGSSIIATVKHIGNDTLLSYIGRLLRKAQAERPRISMLANRVASYFVLGVISLAALVGLYWWQVDASRAFEIVLAVLIVTCPCALSLATPAALTVAIGRFAHEGLLITSSEAIEKLAQVTHVLFDKTGTLTKGKPGLRQVVALSDLSIEDCIEYACALEQYSEHSIASAFKNEKQHLQADAIQIAQGLGIEGVIDGRKIRIGKVDYVAELSHAKIPTQPTGRHDSSWIAMGDNKAILSWFDLGDVLRANAKRCCSELKELGFPVEMISGDQAAPVSYLAGKLDIKAQSQFTADDKLAYMRSLQEHGQRVVMIGDGINDAPVLAGADISIAMSGGANLAHSSADMLLMHENLALVPQAILNARQTIHIIRQNMSWAIIYNVTAVPLAATGYLAPWLAAIGMSLSSLLVVLNALRLSARTKQKPAAQKPLTA